jgi:tetratricopeptide (TPR) repeat protein
MTPTKGETAFGSRLRRLRLERSLSQRDLAEPHYTAAYISTVEAGKRRPSRAALEHFANKLGVEVDQLLTGKPPDLEARLEIYLNDARVLLSAGRLKEARKLLDRTRREAKKYNLVRYEARGLEGHALIAEHEDELDRAIEIYEEVCEMLADHPPTARTSSATGLARLSHITGNSHYAIHVLERFLVELVVSRLPDPQAMMSAHAGLVLPYFDVGLYEQAAVNAREALKLTSDRHDPEAIATMNLQVARVMLEEGRIKDAEISLGRAEEIFRTLDMKSELAAVRFAHGYSLARADRWDEAERLLRSALKEYEDVGRKVEQARVGNELARLYRIQGRTAEAIPIVTASIKVLEGSASQWLARSYRELAMCEGLDSSESAEKNLRRAIELFELAEAKAELAATQALLGDLLGAIGRSDDACEAYHRGASLFLPQGDGLATSS